MNCHQAHEEITYILTKDVEPTGHLQPHLEECMDCRHHWQQQAVEQWASRMLQIPAPMVAQVANGLQSGFVLSNN